MSRKPCFWNSLILIKLLVSVRERSLIFLFDQPVSFVCLVDGPLWWRNTSTPICWENTGLDSVKRGTISTHHNLVYGERDNMWTFTLLKGRIRFRYVLQSCFQDFLLKWEIGHAIHFQVLKDDSYNPLEACKPLSKTSPLITVNLQLNITWDPPSP